MVKLDKIFGLNEGKSIFRIENVNLDTIITYKKDGVRHNFLDEY